MAQFLSLQERSLATLRVAVRYGSKNIDKPERAFISLQVDLNDIAHGNGINGPAPPCREWIALEKP
jgi:hypothetical protein